MPTRLNRLVRVLQKDPGGFTLETPKSGSHYKLHGPGGLKYSVPAHGGAKTELPDLYIKKLCRYFGLDYEGVKARL